MTLVELIEMLEEHIRRHPSQKTCEVKGTLTIVTTLEPSVTIREQ